MSPMGDHPHRRGGDTRPVVKASDFIAEYRSILYPLTIIALALGFKFSTPSRRLDAVEKMQQTDHANVAVLVKLQCFNPSFTDEQRAMVGLQGCRELRQGSPDPSRDRALQEP